jgi:oligosaccharyltransferase complex subunit delta (ribophorin II)
VLNLLAVLSTACAVSGVFLHSYVSERDVAALRKVFSEAIAKRKDVASVYYGIAGLSLLNDKIPDQQSLCRYLQAGVDGSDFSKLFTASGGAALLDACKLTVPNVEATLKAGIKDQQTVQNLGFIAAAARSLKIKVDETKLLSAFAAAIKKDDSISIIPYALHAVAHLRGDLKPFIDRIEDIVAQADEVNGEYLQYEGGLSVTARVISGIYSLAEKMNNTPPMKPAEAVKFTNYLLNRKGVQLVRPAFHMLRALKFLTTSKHHIPVSISLVSGVAVSPAQGRVQVRVCDVLGQSLTSAKSGTTIGVLVESATHKETSGVVISKKAMSLVASDKTKTNYDFNLLEQKRDKGFYKLQIQVSSSKDKRLVGTTGEVTVKVLTEVVLDGVQLSVVDREQQATAGNTMSVQHPNKISRLVEADTHQKLLMKFVVKDRFSNQAITVHQAFVIFTHVDTKQEIIFVAEADSSKAYKFDVDLQKSSKEFNNLSGRYEMVLVLGDAVVNNPVSWKVADISLKFVGQKSKSDPTKQISYEKKPEIKHLFREPEKRPPAVVSNAFVVFVAVPLLLLFIMWISIGLNFSNFSFSLSTIGFHLGLAGIFGLYALFWYKLNMFETLKYLVGIASITFLCGNAMLRAMAERRKSKTD